MSKPRIVTIIQARMASSRLPGKVMKEIDDKAMLMQVVDRASLSKLVDAVGVATTTDPSDDPIEGLCRANGCLVYRGSMFDVLDRFYRASQAFEADVIVRLTADCPLIDVEVLDRTISTFLDSDVDFAANRLPPPWKRTYPIGLDTEVCSFAGLERTWNEAAQPYQREHVMPYFYDWTTPGGLIGRQEGRFRIQILDYEVDYGSLRWTVDTPQDLEVVRQIFIHFSGRQYFGWLEVLDLIQNHPELRLINVDVHHKTGFDVDDRNLLDVRIGGRKNPG